MGSTCVSNRLIALVVRFRGARLRQRPLLGLLAPPVLLALLPFTVRRRVVSSERTAGVVTTVLTGALTASLGCSFRMGDLWTHVRWRTSWIPKHSAIPPHFAVKTGGHVIVTQCHPKAPQTHCSCREPKFKQRANGDVRQTQLLAIVTTKVLTTQMSSRRQHPIQQELADGFIGSDSLVNYPECDSKRRQATRTTPNTVPIPTASNLASVCTTKATQAPSPRSLLLSACMGHSRLCQAEESR